MAAGAFLQTLLAVSEKAATIARVIRSDHRLFQMLIEEKTGEHSNKRFIQDFKTLADVLIQETIKHDIGRQFPHMVDNIKGEESNKFTNTIGESIHVKVKDTEQETCALLVNVLDGDVDAARILARTVHSSVLLDILSGDHKARLSKVDFSTDNLGIWIDPIDGTSEYIHGRQDGSMLHGIYSFGLQCCTVLIGAYDLNTGMPVMGVVNRPFEAFDAEANTWKGKAFWGLSSPTDSISSMDIPSERRSHPIVVISANESQTLKRRLTDRGYRVLHGSGAGYKLLCVALGLADIYILSRPSTFMWDSCAPHSLLHAVHGGILDYREAISGNKVPISYHRGDDQAAGINVWCNQGGMIAYADERVLGDFLKSV